MFRVYDLDTWSRDLNTEFTLRDCLFRAVKLTKKYHPDEYGYSCHGIGFDSHSIVSINGEWGKNVIIFGVDSSSSMHTENRKKDILVMCLVKHQ